MIKGNLLRFKPTKELFIVMVFMVLCWVFNFIADQFIGTNWFYFLYQGLFALGICISLPILFTTIKMGRPLSALGIKSNWKKALIIGLAISSVLFFGRMMGMNINILNKTQFISIVICMIFSTLFEEIFFRGFLQTRFENFFGIIPSVILSAGCFMLYHTAQSFIGFGLHDMITLFCIGIIFGIAYRVTGNILTSFLVNLPQAILTFVGDENFIEYGKNINLLSAIVCIFGIIIAITLIFQIKKRYRIS